MVGSSLGDACAGSHRGVPVVFEFREHQTALLGATINRNRCNHWGFGAVSIYGGRLACHSFSGLPWTLTRGNIPQGDAYVIDPQQDLRPRGMTPEQLLMGTEWAARQFYSWKSIFSRLQGSRLGLWWNFPRNAHSGLRTWFLTLFFTGVPQFRLTLVSGRYKDNPERRSRP